MAHTPGPWKIDFNDIGNGSCQWRIVGSDEIQVAYSPVGPHAFDKANARLIAAAPALLEALEGIRHQVDNTAPYSDELKDSIVAIGAIARAAIEEVNASHPA